MYNKIKVQNTLAGFKAAADGLKIPKNIDWFDVRWLLVRALIKSSK